MKNEDLNTHRCLNENLKRMMWFGVWRQKKE